VAGDVRGMMMWHSCMSREVPLVGYTNISIDDLSLLTLVIISPVCGDTSRLVLNHNFYL
jgi:hypothetical protein